jgi:hypothetical protein
MKNKLKKTIMEKTNWIEKIKEAVRVAMNKGKHIDTYYDDALDMRGFRIEVDDDSSISIDFFKGAIIIYTRNGCLHVNYDLTDRDKLELQALALSIKEYKEDMAISEFEEFISDKKEEITNINDLDNDEE